MMNSMPYDDILRRSLAEDIGHGDITTLTTVDKDKQIKGRFIAKEEGVVCGLPVVARVFALLDEAVKVYALVREGDIVKKGDVLAHIAGPARSILTGERVALNFLQRLCGIATATRRATEQIQGTKTVIADTRKTTPGLRLLEKYAVRVGGGTNHRYNLSDGILIKDNHIAAAGGIAKAIGRARRGASHLLKIEVETETLDQVKEALENGADVIMLDNMSLDDMKKAVAFIGGRALVEVSGNMGDKNLWEVAQTGVDIISMGALTHTVKAMDISLRLSNAD